MKKAFTSIFAFVIILALCVSNVAFAADNTAVEEKAETAATDLELDLSVRPVVTDENGFCVTYDEMCGYLLGLLKGDCPKYKIWSSEKMPTAEFRDHVDTIDEEIAQQNAHRYLFVDGEYTGVLIAAHNTDKSVVTGDSTFTSISVGIDEEADIDDDTGTMLEAVRALLYLVDAVDDYDNTLSAVQFFFESIDTVKGLGKKNPFFGIFTSDPFEFDLFPKENP